MTGEGRGPRSIPTPFPSHLFILFFFFFLFSFDEKNVKKLAEKGKEERVSDRKEFLQSTRCGSQGVGGGLF